MEMDCPLSFQLNPEVASMTPSDPAILYTNYNEPNNASL
jgi:hypothetical protein